MSNVPHSPLCMCQACQDEVLASEMRKDAETLRAVTAERDTLLHDCWEACGGKGPDSSDDELAGTISTMRVGLERWQKRACAAEAERDKLRARIENAPQGIAKAGAWDFAPNSAFLSARLPQRYAGKRVALVLLGDDER